MMSRKQAIWKKPLVKGTRGLPLKNANTAAQQALCSNVFVDNWSDLSLNIVNIDAYIKTENKNMDFLWKKKKKKKKNPSGGQVTWDFNLPDCKVIRHGQADGRLFLTLYHLIEQAIPLVWIQNYIWNIKDAWYYAGSEELLINK